MKLACLIRTMGLTAAEKPVVKPSHSDLVGGNSEIAKFCQKNHYTLLPLKPKLNCEICFFFAKMLRLAGGPEAQFPRGGPTGRGLFNNPVYI